jgi:hypothetical protein
VSEERRRGLAAGAKLDSCDSIGRSGSPSPSLLCRVRSIWFCWWCCYCCCRLVGRLKTSAFITGVPKRAHARTDGQVAPTGWRAWRHTRRTRPCCWARGLRRIFALQSEKCCCGVGRLPLNNCRATLGRCVRRWLALNQARVCIWAACARLRRRGGTSGANPNSAIALVVSSCKQSSFSLVWCKEVLKFFGIDNCVYVCAGTMSSS